MKSAGCPKIKFSKLVFLLNSYLLFVGNKKLLSQPDKIRVGARIFDDPVNQMPN